MKYSAREGATEDCAVLKGALDFTVRVDGPLGAFPPLHTQASGPKMDSRGGRRASRAQNLKSAHFSHSAKRRFVQSSSYTWDWFSSLCGLCSLLGLFSLLSDLASKSLWYLMVYSTAEFSHLRSGLFNVQLCFPSSSSYPNGIMKIESVLECVLRLYGENNQHKLDSIYYCFKWMKMLKFLLLYIARNEKALKMSTGLAQSTLSHEFHNASSFYIVLHLYLVKYFDRFTDYFSKQNERFFKWVLWTVNSLVNVTYLYS